MRYIRYKTVVSRVLDRIIDDPDVVHAILSAIKEKELNFRLKANDGIWLEECRLLELGSSSFRFRTTKNGTTLRKKCNIEDVDCLEVNTQAEVLVSDKPQVVSRWFMLDPREVLDGNGG